MNFKQYMYEFVGFGLFYGLAALIFGSESRVACLLSGIVGVFFGKFVSKANGFFINEAVNHLITDEENGKFHVSFVLKANYKTKPVLLYGSYTTTEVIDSKTLSILLYDKFKDHHYKKILKQGFTNIKVDLKTGPIEIVIEK